jgi:predicted restriction endonuclease
MVAHAYNLNYSGVEIGRIMAQGQPRQKVSKTYFNQEAVCGGACLSSQLCGRLR